MVGEEIKKSVEEKISNNPELQTSTIQVEVREGDVILKGIVPSRLARRAAETDALSVSGVEAVDNQLTIKLGPEPPVSDEELASVIKDMLHLSPEIDAIHIRVSVSQGIVTLKGAVDADWKRDWTEEIALDVPGVRGANNELTIKPVLMGSDEIIAGEIEGAIKADIIDENIQVAFKKGVVTLSGTVPTWEMYESAEEIARQTPGVTEVKNLITVE